MGLLNKWFDRKKKDQLATVEKKRPAVSAGVKKDELAESKSGPKKTTFKSGGVKDAFKILIKPVVSEKAAKMENQGIYVFVVDSGATKRQVADAIKELYGVAVEKIRMINVEGKRTRFGRQEGRRRDWKKALITLPKGQTIKIHEGV